MKKEMKKDIENKNWKNKNPKYLFELQKFLDLADNVEDIQIRKLLINQMIKLDKTIKAISEENFKKLSEETN